MTQILKFLKDRLKEGSTWVAAGILGALGLSGELSQATIDLVIAALSVLIALKPEKSVNGNAPSEG